MNPELFLVWRVLVAAAIFFVVHEYTRRRRTR